MKYFYGSSEAGFSDWSVSVSLPWTLKNFLLVVLSDPQPLLILFILLSPLLPILCLYPHGSHSPFSFYVFSSNSLSTPSGYQLVPHSFHSLLFCISNRYQPFVIFSTFGFLFSVQLHVFFLSRLRFLLKLRVYVYIFSFINVTITGIWFSTLRSQLRPPPPLPPPPPPHFPLLLTSSPPLPLHVPLVFSSHGRLSPPHDKRKKIQQLVNLVNPPPASPQPSVASPITP